MENRSEFFDKNVGRYAFEKISGRAFNSPVSYVLFDDFKEFLAGYETNYCDEHTKLWVFLSLTNFVEVYTNSEPEKRIVYHD
jgi:hypothetical protein